MTIGGSGRSVQRTGSVAQPRARVEIMPLSGEYKPSTSDWARKQAEKFEATDGAEANLLRGVPIIVLTSVGAKTGGLRKTALMRVEHDGRYLVVASKGGHPKPPAWYWNVRADSHVELQDGPVK